MAEAVRVLFYDKSHDILMPGANGFCSILNLQRAFLVLSGTSVFRCDKFETPADVVFAALVLMAGPASFGQFTLLAPAEGEPPV